MAKIQSLLDIVLSENFVPSPGFEKLLISKFLKTLHSVVKNNFSERDLGDLKGYADCILIVADKDDKFISLYIRSMDSLSCQLLTSVVRNTLPDTHDGLYNSVLSLICQMMRADAEKVNSFILFELHNFVLKNTSSSISPWIKNISNALICLNIFEVMNNDTSIVSELYSINSMSWCLEVLENLYENFIKHDLFHEILIKILDFLNYTLDQGSISNTLQLRKCDKVFTKLLKLVPQDYAEVIWDVKRLLAVNIENQKALKIDGFSVKSNIVKPAKAITKPILMKIDNKNTEMIQISISQLKQNPVSAPQIENLQDATPVIYSQLAVFEQFCDRSDVMLNSSCFKDISIENICDLVCGMLNSNTGGNIFIGLHSTKRVIGIKLSEEERNQLKSGLDNFLMDELTPVIIANGVHVHFTPVKGRDSKDDGSLCLVKIRVPAKMHTVYRMKTKNVCYMFRAGLNKELSLPEVRKLVILMIEKRYICPSK